jgi:hypothetical protein
MMTNPNDLLSRIESARLWRYFHKDWLMQIRPLLRSQLPDEYALFVESEAVLIAPDSNGPEVHKGVHPDVSVTTPGASAPIPDPKPVAGATLAVVEAEEACEIETHYSLVIRRAPENCIVAALELLSPSNKGIGSRLDRRKHLGKRQEYLDAGVNLLEIDALIQGERDLPEQLVQLAPFPRIAWSATHDDGLRRYRGWGWGPADPLPKIDWQVDEGRVVLVDLGKSFTEAAEFNPWETLTAP